MGIARLIQDLQPYADILLLGGSYTGSSQIQIKSIVIDGPSLVYNVYGRLLAHSHINTSPTIAQLPTYCEINSGLRQFLTDLQRCGLSIARIFFDGSLPKSKQSVRLDRLEKTRQQLETFRKINPSLSINAAPGKRKDTGPSLWHSIGPSSRKYTLPAPPFLVAAAIESLLMSEWRDVISVVDGEADESCATYAKSNQTAVLSDDSDLVLYDLGNEDCVIHLSSLSLRENHTSRLTPVLTAQGLRQSKIVMQLGISNLLRFGYERSKDTSVSTAIIKQRAKANTALESDDDEDWRIFKQIFRPLTNDKAAIKKANLNMLDPRVAEVVSSLSHGDVEVRSYLLMLHEDPTRDSSWSYGKQIRQLAYSLLHCIYTVTTGSQQCSYISEHSRRGQRIAEEKVSLLSEPDLCAGLEAFQKRTRILSDNHQTDDDAGDLAIRYLRVALEIILSSKISAGKLYDSTTFRRVFGLKDGATHCSWDDIHLNGNIQAVIYSVRMLKQVAKFGRSTYAVPDSGLQRALSSCTNHLRDMPSLEDVILDLAQTKALMSRFSPEDRISWLQDLLAPARAEDAPKDETRKSHSHAVDPALHDQIAHTQMNQQTRSSLRDHRDKRTAKLSQVPAAKKPKYSSANMFDLLQELG